MIKLFDTLPESPTIALSGGVDSMAVADFISRTRNIRCAFFHHGTPTSEAAHDFLGEYCGKRGWNLVVGRLVDAKPAEASPEEWWRVKRYEFLDELGAGVVTAHHLDDCLETWIWSSLHGTPKVIPYRRNRVVRPFLLTKKADLVNWAKRNIVPWVDDASNSDPRYMRNYIRQNMVHHALHVNPGLHKVVARKLVKEGLTIDKTLL